jgi:serine/threonine protein kinase
MNDDATVRGGGPVTNHGPTEDLSSILGPQAAQELALPFLTPTDAPGSLGRLGYFEILGILGRGGFGVVLKAHDPRLDRTVAIKVMSPELAATSPARKRFLREARAAAAVRHEYVVQVYAIEEEPLPYIVMEYIPGETLQQRIDRNGPLPAIEVVRLGAQIAAGLAAAHDQGLVHRDVKPANVMLDAGSAGIVKLTDFGLARTVDDASVSQSGLVAGTPLYMAPEQVRGETIDARADLFALGSVMYTMTCGHPPFRASTTFAVLQRVANDVPRPIRDVIPETPDWICRSIAKLHEKDPAHRYQSAKSFADDLLRATSPKAAVAAKSGGVPLPYAIAAGLSVAVAVLATVVVLTWTPKPSANSVASTTVPPAAAMSIAERLTSPKWTWGEPINLGPTINSRSRELSASLTDDECTIVFSRENQLVIARRASRDEPFGEGKLLPESINTKVREGASISGDGTILIFPSNRNGSFHLWMATRPNVDAEFGEPIELNGPVNGDGYDIAACLSGDGLALYHHTYRTGIAGKGDVVSTRRPNRTSDFVRFQLHPSPLNTPHFDVCDWVSHDELTIVVTHMPEGFPQETRIMSRASKDEPFANPRSLGAVFDQIVFGRPWLSPGGERIYFHSRAIPNGHGELDLWMAKRVEVK